MADGTFAGLVIAVLLLAVVAGAWMRALFDLFLRPVAQAWWVHTWLIRRWQAVEVGRRAELSDVEERLVNTGRARTALYSLEYRQICSQVANSALSALVAIRRPDQESALPLREWELVAVFTGHREDVDRFVSGGGTRPGPGSPDFDGDADHQRLVSMIEKTVDELQAYLASAWMIFRYALAYAVVGVLLAPAIVLPTGAQVFGLAPLVPFATMFAVLVAALVALLGPAPAVGLLVALVPVVWVALAAPGFSGLDATIGFNQSFALLVGAGAAVLVPTMDRLLDRI